MKDYQQQIQIKYFHLHKSTTHHVIWLIDGYSSVTTFHYIANKIISTFLYIV